jgi:hypothetical protein
MSRESKIRAVSGALQAKGFDLGQYQKSERRLRVRSDVAAGALGFAGARGDPLPGLLLRLKYAGERGEEAFTRAQALLVHRYGGLAPRSSQIVGAVALGALLEWCHDACQKCRSRREKAGRVAVCPCVNRLEARHSRGGREDPNWQVRHLPVGLPLPGCAKCAGMGRLFAQAERIKGIACKACNSTGRVSFDAKKRWRVVNEIVGAAQREMGYPVEGMPFRSFLKGWNFRYESFIDVLRLTDRLKVGVGLDFGFEASEPFTVECDGDVIPRTEREPEDVEVGLPE